MNPNWVTVSLFHGDAGWITGALALWGGIRAFTIAQNWVTDRYSFDFNWLRLATLGQKRPGNGSIAWDLWIGIPRRLKIYRRWDRPGAMVGLYDGRPATVLWVTSDPDAGGVALVQPYDVAEEEAQRPEWAAVASLSPLPRPAAVVSAS
jgi:hypothetical protein